MVKIKYKIEESYCALCLKKENKSTVIGIIDSYLQLLDVRIQIKNEQSSDYYISWNDIIIGIDKNGQLESYPEGFFDETINLLLQLI